MNLCVSFLYKGNFTDWKNIVEPGGHFTIINKSVIKGKRPQGFAHMNYL